MQHDAGEKWRDEPASEAQLRKLRYYRKHCRLGLTKGEASDLIDDVMSEHPEKEKSYQLWKESEDDTAEWYEQAIMSDFYQEGDMRKPTREMIQETIAFLKASRPNWRYEVRDNSFAILLMERYPELEKR